MTDLNISKSDTAKMPMVRHAAEVGWVPVSRQEALTPWRYDRAGESVQGVAAQADNLGGVGRDLSAFSVPALE